MKCFFDEKYILIRNWNAENENKVIFKTYKEENRMELHQKTSLKEYDDLVEPISVFIFSGSVYRLMRSLM